MIFEIMGRPAEYIKETLSQLVDKIKAEKGCVIQEKKIFDPKAVEQYKDIFTTFAEVEMTFETLDDLLRVIFNYLPSHIDIVSPQTSSLSNTEMNALANQLTGKLHQYDELAKRMMLENDALKKYIENLKGDPQILEPQVVVGGRQEEEGKKEEKNKKEEKAIENVKKSVKKRAPKKKKEEIPAGGKEDEGRERQEEEMHAAGKKEEKMLFEDKAEEEIGGKERLWSKTRGKDQGVKVWEADELGRIKGENNNRKIGGKKKGDVRKAIEDDEGGNNNLGKIKERGVRGMVEDNRRENNDLGKVSGKNLGEEIEDEDFDVDEISKALEDPEGIYDEKREDVGDNTVEED